jgi:hypothetical protein
MRIVRGLQTAKTKRAKKKEKDAVEAGILLPVKKRVKSIPRERGLNTASGVGKFRNGMLKIHEREINRINNSGAKGRQNRGRGIKKLFK